MTIQEHLNDIAQKLDKLILRAIKGNRSVYIIELKIFLNTRLNQSENMTEHALRQTYNDLGTLLTNLNAEMFADEIDWCVERALKL